MWLFCTMGVLLMLLAGTLHKTLADGSRGAGHPAGVCGICAARQQEGFLFYPGWAIRSIAGQLPLAQRQPAACF